MGIKSNSFGEPITSVRGSAHYLGVVMLGHERAERLVCKGDEEDGQREIQMSHSADPVREKGREKHGESESVSAM